MSCKESVQQMKTSSCNICLNKDLSCLGFLGGVSSECKYAGCLEDYVIVQILKIMRYQTGSQCNDLRSGTEREKR